MAGPSDRGGVKSLQWAGSMAAVGLGKNANTVFVEKQMPRKQRVDSNAAAVKVMQAATNEIAPPSHVPMEDMDWPFWHNVVAEFARVEWTEHQLELAAMLARTMANLEAEQRTLRAEGFISKRENGTTVENPRARAVKSLTGDILSLRRSLALHARAKSGEARDVGKRRDQAKQVESGASFSDLLPSPSIQ